MSSQFMPVPWQRNLRKIPQHVQAKLAAAPATAQFVAGVVKVVKVDALARGELHHLGMGVSNGAVTFSARVALNERAGPYSNKNQNGWEVVHRDLPMVTRSFSVETPNFGDPSKGYHTVWVDREVYQRDYIDPPGFAFLIEKVKESRAGEVVFKVVVDFPLNRADPDFEDNLFFALNLLQENLGAADILLKDASVTDLLSPLTLDWEIFPPGTVDEVVSRAVKGLRNPTREQEQTVRARLALFNRLKPVRYVQGRGSMNHYIGALFADDLVVFENVRYGNALYVLYEGWDAVSKRSRIDLLKCRDVRFDRFVHGPGWEQRFSRHIRAEKRKRNLGGDEGTLFNVA
ncbi:hypothetical protein GJ689_21560 [Rhodoplanes serenus]|uniref:Uncharacterized protein n=1 Tax=Rhodoplanes serenus TaxID=200615 RepID=A0A9X4XP71_9BRAD|nr:hypothetical protein [Rhodoplanes serenus]MTW18792.1 hypothetical protein [Rhodoplanes serenus]